MKVCSSSTLCTEMNFNCKNYIKYSSNTVLYSIFITSGVFTQMFYSDAFFIRIIIIIDHSSNGHNVLKFSECVSSLVLCDKKMHVVPTARTKTQRHREKATNVTDVSGAMSCCCSGLNPEAFFLLLNNLCQLTQQPVHCF